MTKKTVDALQKLLGATLEANSQIHEALDAIVSHGTKTMQALKVACDEEIAKIRDEAERRITETRRHFAELQRIEKERQDQLVALLNRFDEPEPEKRPEPRQSAQPVTLPVKNTKAA